MFWIVVLTAVAATLALAWWFDRRHKARTITQAEIRRRHDQLEADKASGLAHRPDTGPARAPFSGGA